MQSYFRQEALDKKFEQLLCSIKVDNTTQEIILKGLRALRPQVHSIFGSPHIMSGARQVLKLGMNYGGVNQKKFVKIARLPKDLHSKH